MYMATAKQPKVVKVVKRAGDSHEIAARDTRKKGADVQAKARAQRKAADRPAAKKAVKSVHAPEIKREEPHIRKMDDGKPLQERLNPKLLEQLRTRRVTNKVAAIALEVSETYLCRVLKELGHEKERGVTTEHREARTELRKAREQTRDMLAKKVNRQEMTIEKAAKSANCSVRTMFRYCAKFA